MADTGDESFNLSRAEVFEALGHPTRIRILQAVSERPLPFSELKHAVGLESNGLLSFHLGRLTGLVKLNDEGLYTVTDEGKEALRIVDAGRKQDEGHPSARPALHLPHQKTILAGLLVALIVLGSVAVYQQEQISSLHQQKATGTVIFGSVTFWNETIPVFTSNDSSVAFHGVTFTSIMPSFAYSYSDPSHYIFSGSVRLSNGTLLDLTGKSVMVQMNGAPGYELMRSGQMGFGTSLDSEVVVSLPGGGRETFNPFSVTAVNSPGNFDIGHEFVLLNVTYSYPLVNPWFTDHTGPRVGIFWNYANGDLELFVSAS